MKKALIVVLLLSLTSLGCASFVEDVTTVVEEIAVVVEEITDKLCSPDSEDDLKKGFSILNSTIESLALFGIKVSTIQEVVDLFQSGKLADNFGAYDDDANEIMANIEYALELLLALCPPDLASVNVDQSVLLSVDGAVLRIER